jgi:tRNA(Met) cytidine acetyltransferase
VIVAGERQWGQDLARQFSSQKNFQQSLWVSDQELVGERVVACRQAGQFIGQELDFLVYDAWAGLNPDALASVSGALCGGSLLLLLVPPLQQWPQYRDPDYQRMLVYPFSTEHIAGRFLTHLQQSLLSAADTLLIEQGCTANALAMPARDEKLQVWVDDCLSEDQAQTVAAIIRVMRGHRHRPLVIRSDRGRGKSSALGIASARLIQDGVGSIVITAPRLESVQPVFEHAARVLGIEQEKSSILRYGHSSLKFIAADELLRNQHDIDLLLVDEAAAIPAAMLECFLASYSRIVFSTTVHGYEGTGRGFDLRFRKTLDQVTPQWKSLQLTQPIRWAAHDPLERSLFDALLLDASAVEDSQLQGASSSLCVTQLIDRDCLLRDKKSLAQLFGLLVLAHYQTTPSDLRNVLDGPNITVWVSRFQGQIVAACLVASEGGFDLDMSMAIWKSQRRPQGHLLPQTLSAHVGLKQAPQLRYQRIMRIAVHPALQRQGIGKQLIHRIVEQARSDQYDLVGSSFAASTDVLAFWRSIECLPVRLGVSRDTCSGSYSAIVLSPLSSDGAMLMAAARSRFTAQFRHQLASCYRELEPELVAELLVQSHAPNTLQLSPQDWLDIEAFAKAYRQFDMCSLPLWKLVCIAISDPRMAEQLSAHQRALLIKRVLQHQDVPSVVAAGGLAGKKQLTEQLRAAINTLYQLSLSVSYLS